MLEVEERVLSNGIVAQMLETILTWLGIATLVSLLLLMVGRVLIADFFKAKSELVDSIIAKKQEDEPNGQS